MKPGRENNAKQLFGERVKITTEGKRHLGAALGSNTFREEYSMGLVEEWSKQLQDLCDVAMTQPQAAYTAYIRGFESKLTWRISKERSPTLETISDLSKNFLKPSSSRRCLDSIHLYQPISST